jgi:hypothetical protein
MMHFGLLGQGGRFVLGRALFGGEFQLVLVSFLKKIAM